MNGAWRWCLRSFRSSTKAGLEVVVEAGAGASAGFPDSEYISRGAKILPAREEVFRTAEIILQVLSHGSNDATGKEDLPLLAAASRCWLGFCDRWVRSRRSGKSLIAASLRFPWS